MRINVKAKPNAKEERVQEVQPGEFVVAVKEPPVQGKANAAIIRVLSEYFHTPNIRIVSGYMSRNKIIEIG